MTAKKAKPAAPPALQGNDRFLVLDYTIAGDPAQQISSLRRRVYLLPPGAHFEGFGGSKSGLDTGKTPSLIVRDSTRHGSSDFETNLANPETWRVIEDGLRAAAEAKFRAVLQAIRDRAGMGSIFDTDQQTGQTFADMIDAVMPTDAPAQEDAG